MRRVEVVAYRSEWPVRFAEEAALLRQLWGEELLELHHIGSTSVPGLAAKPIIDLLAAVPSLERLDQNNEDMARLGYRAHGEYGIPGRRYFSKGETPRTHHLHAFLQGDPHLTRHLAFRDYLRHFPHIAQEYGQLKQQLAQQLPNNIQGYMDGKDPWIRKIQEQALAWYPLQARKR
jgi:GrpB-like predicted nucleotidyltransferase (UPF0157 family)